MSEYSENKVRRYEALALDRKRQRDEKKALSPKLHKAQKGVLRAAKNWLTISNPKCPSCVCDQCSLVIAIEKLIEIEKETKK